MTKAPKICHLKKATTERRFCWFWSMSREICQRSKHLLDACRAASCELHLPPNFSLFLSSFAVAGCMRRRREIPNKSDLHSATLMICVDWPHSACCQKISFSREISQASKGVSGFSSSPSGRLDSSPEIRFTGTSSSSSSVVGSTRGPGGATFYLPRGAHTVPQGNWCTTSIWETNYQGCYRRHLGE